MLFRSSHCIARILRALECGCLTPLLCRLGPRRPDFLTTDIMLNKVSGAPCSVFSRGQRWFQYPSLYIYLLIVIMSGMSSGPVCRGFLPDIIPDESVRSCFRQAAAGFARCVHRFRLT